MTVEDHRDEANALLATSDDDVVEKCGVSTSCDWEETGHNRKVRSCPGRVFPVPSAIGKINVHPLFEH